MIPSSVGSPAEPRQSKAQGAPPRAAAVGCAELRSGWPPGAFIFQDELRAGPGRGRRRGRPRNAVPSGYRTPPCLSPPDRALRATVGRASVRDWAAAGRGRGSGCACRRGRQGAAAASGRRRKSRGARQPRRPRTLSAPAPETRTPPGLNRARPIVAAATLRVPPSGHAWGLSFGLPGVGTGGSIPSSGRRQEERRRRRPAGRDPRAGLNNGARRWRDPRVRPAAVEEAAGRRPPPHARPSLRGRPHRLGLHSLASAHGGSARSMVPAPGSL